MTTAGAVWGGLLRLHRLFIRFSAVQAIMYSESGQAMGPAAVLLDRLTKLWSSLILATHLVKFFSLPGELASSAAICTLNGTTSGEHRPVCVLSGRELLLLNYLPRINDFGKLYYGLISVAVGFPLLWRVYMQQVRWALLPERRPHSNSRLARRKLLDFLLDGHPAPSGGPQCQQQERKSWPIEHQVVFESLGGQRRLHSLNTFGDACQVRLALVSQLRRRRKPLSRLYSRLSSCEAANNNNNSVSIESTDNNDNNDNQDNQDHNNASSATEQQPCSEYRDETYSNPLRSEDFLDAYCCPACARARWRHLAGQVYAGILLALALMGPILYVVLRALGLVMHRFTLPPNAHIILPTGHASSGSASSLAGWLRLYGRLEQFYACWQACVFFFFTNIFITLFHADLTYKLRPVSAELAELLRTSRLAEGQPAGSGQRRRRRQRRQSAEQSRRQTHYKQLRVWAYFEQLEHLDDFVANYSVVAMITLVIGFSFGQSYLKVEDPALKVGTIAVLVANIISFSYLYMLSWNIERQTTRLYPCLMSIIARDHDYPTKHVWQKILIGFFESDRKRTFSFNHRYPLNLHSYFRTVFGLATISLVMNRVFHKRTWDSSLGSSPAA